MSLGLTESELWVRAGWTMIHDLWVGTLLGLGAVACKWALKSATAHARYLVALGWLAALAISPIAIAVWVGPVETAAAAQQRPDTLAVVAPDSTTSGASAGALRDDSVEGEDVHGLGSAAATLPWGRVVAVLPWIWLFGSPVVFAWSVAGLAGAERLRRLSSPTGDPKLEELCRRLARSLKVFREVSIRLSTRIASPVLAGILRPVILLPPALLSGLAPEQVEMLLLHELAHVRRWDNLVNFVQRTIESALFFHPVVWLVSRWVRQEREHCCDAMVLQRSGDGVLYAETLLAVAQKGLSAKRLRPLGIVLANSAVSPAVPGNLRSRIDRILRRENQTMQVSRKLSRLATAALLTAAALLASIGLSTGHAELSEDLQPAVSSERESENSAEVIGGQAADGDMPQRGVFQPRTVPSNSPSTPPLSYVDPQYVDSQDDETNTLFFSERVHVGDFGGREGVASVWVRPLDESLQRPSTNELPFAPQLGPGYGPARRPIPLPYEFGGDYLVNADDTFPAASASESHGPPDGSAQPATAQEEAKPHTQGEVCWVNQRNRTAWVDLGREKGVKKGTKFRVFYPGPKAAPLGGSKGVLVITRILGDHLAEARIEEEIPSHPIMPGDRVYSPLWKAQQGEPSGDASPIERTDAEGVAALQTAVAERVAALHQETSMLREQLRTLQQQRDTLFDKVVELTEELHVLATEHAKTMEAQRAFRWDRRKGAEPAAGPPPRDVEGVVLADSENAQVEISIGSDDGLTTGHRLEVYRREGTEEMYGITSLYVGRIEVLLTQRDRSICRVLSEFLQRPVRKGDRVATKLPRDVETPLRVTVNIDEEGQISVDGKRITLEELPEALSSGLSRPASVHLSITAHSEVAQRRIVELLTKCAEARIEVLSVKLLPVARDDGPPDAAER